MDAIEIIGTAILIFVFIYTIVDTCRLVAERTELIKFIEMMKPRNVVDINVDTIQREMRLRTVIVTE